MDTTENLRNAGFYLRSDMRGMSTVLWDAELGKIRVALREAKGDMDALDGQLLHEDNGEVDRAFALAREHYKDVVSYYLKHLGYFRAETSNGQ